jgi:hypothetical protein
MPFSAPPRAVSSAGQPAQLHGFKQYQRYGLSRELWTAFNFERPWPRGAGSLGARHPGACRFRPQAAHKRTSACDRSLITALGLRCWLRKPSGKPVEERMSSREGGSIRDGLYSDQRPERQNGVFLHVPDDERRNMRKTAKAFKTQKRYASNWQPGRRTLRLPGQRCNPDESRRSRSSRPRRSDQLRIRVIRPFFVYSKVELTYLNA